MARAHHGARQVKARSDEREVPTFLIQEMHKILYKKTLDYFSLRLHTIIAENSEIYGNDQTVCVHRGELFGSETYTKKNLTLPAVINPLAETLYPVMDEWLTDFRKEYTNESVYTLNYLKTVFLLSNTFEDFEALLPFPLLEPLNAYSDKFQDASAAMTEEDVEVFKEKNAAYCKMVKDRLMFNVISH